jgi:erythromycin esterase
MAELSWPWRTREFAEMLRWMRQYNASVPPALRIEFHGFDYQGQQRDFRMAQNVLDLLEHAGPGERFVLWAHNGHVSKAEGWMGYYLKRTLRNQIYLTGFEFHNGRFTSNTGWLHTYEAMPVDTRYYASALARVGRPVLFLDFRSAPPELAAWLEHPKLAHDIAEAYGFLRLSRSWVTTDEPWTSLFDGLVYIERSTPAQAW